VEVVRQTIPGTGGVLSVNKPGDPLDGLVLTVPVNGFPQAQDFVISRSEITAHRLGANFNPRTPMIEFSYGGGYSGDALSVKVPIRLPAGHFPMGFLYDRATGKLEPIPLERFDSVSVTVSTRHLSSSGTQAGKRSIFSPQNALGNMVISSIEASILDGQATISSGFTPGVDDWEFPNHGSYIAQGGHCAGQVATELWYYYEQRLKGAPALWGRFDNIRDASNPNVMWLDNPDGYRFASTVQKDMEFDDWIDNSLPVQTATPWITYYSFMYSILLTGAPQFVVIMRSQPRDGHAMIVYKITPATGTLYIADPNYPGNRDPFNGTPTTRIIECQANGFLKPYSSALAAGGPGIVFDQIGYAATTAFIRWDKITERWAEFEKGTIGDDRFPAYQLRVHEPGRVSTVSVDTVRTVHDSLGFSSYCAAASAKIPGTDALQEFGTFTQTGAWLGAGNTSNAGLLLLPVKEGYSRLGFYITGGSAATRKNHYVDFRWVNVYREPSLVDFSKVRRIAVVILSVMTDWKNSNGDPIALGQSPVWSADTLSYAGNVFVGTGRYTRDSIRVTVSSSSVRFSAKSRQSIGSQGLSWVTVSGTMNTSSPEITPGKSFAFRASGAAIGAIVDSLKYTNAGNYTYVGYSFNTNSSFSIMFDY
jgi:hypothetical protein